MYTKDIIEIQNLLYQYCWLVDSGDFEGVGQLFKHMDAFFDGKPGFSKSPEGYLKTMRGIQKYEDGTPKTMHLCVNPQITISEDGQTAEARSYLIVTQGISGKFNPQIIWMDRKFDKFAKIDGKWEFVYRNNCTHAMGDISAHIMGFKK